MIQLILIGYILPMIISITSACVLDKSIKKIGDLSDDIGYFIMPIVNIFFSIIFLVCFINEILKLIKPVYLIYKIKNIKIRD